MRSSRRQRLGHCAVQKIKDELKARYCAMRSSGLAGRNDCIVLGLSTEVAKCAVLGLGTKVVKCAVLGDGDYALCSDQIQGHCFRDETVQCIVQEGWMRLGFQEFMKFGKCGTKETVVNSDMP